MQIIKEQLKRINNFLVLLIPLLIVNLIFNVKYDWGGVSIITRIYIMVLSFYISFIFSQINSDEYREKYTAVYGKKGVYLLFIVLRIFPFFFIYILTIFFTLINYINTPNWPLEPILRLFDGRYSNTVIYSLILFIVLKQKRRPEISIPLFIIFSLLYFALDKTLYIIFDPGYGVIAIKASKYILFLFILIYDYSKDKWKIAKSILFSILLCTIIQTFVVFLFATTFFSSARGTSAFYISGEILLKSGFKFPIDDMLQSILNCEKTNEIRNVLRFIDIYGKETNYSIQEWEILLVQNRIERNEEIFKYLNKHNIKLNFEVIKNYASSQLLVSPLISVGLTEFIKYFGGYYIDNKKEFYKLYNSVNLAMKIIILKSLSYTDDIDAMDFLLDKVTSIELLESEAAYSSLKKITKIDPAFELGKEKYNVDVILYFREYISKIKKDKKNKP
ncbi:MAG: hypothetical protein FWH53_09995 [Leptospirales bacterium]|nr:hypothetical protein [Leptospirales bacterium]